MCLEDWSHSEGLKCYKDEGEVGQVAVEASVDPYQEDIMRRAGGQQEDIWTFCPINRPSGGDGMDSLSADLQQNLWKCEGWRNTQLLHMSSHLAWQWI